MKPLRKQPGGEVAFVLGTRPEIIKLAPLVQLLAGSATVYFTGQHYDDALATRVFADVSLRGPDVLLQVGGLARAAQIGQATEQLAAQFSRRPPRVVVVQGDTNAGIAGALAANSIGVGLVHVEAGLRSFDRAMPEEHNRVLIDHLADVCAAPTDTNAANLRAENVDAARIVVTGNPVVESVRTLLPVSAERSAILAAHGVTRDEFVLATFHRPENVDDTDGLKEIFGALHECAVPVVVPLHPRTRMRLEDAGAGSLLDGLRIIDPLPPRAFLALAEGARFWATDSGGLQEEATVLKRHVIVVRRSTERPEALGVFSRLVARTDLAGALVDALESRHDLAALPSPFGDGFASQRIATLIAERF